VTLSNAMLAELLARAGTEADGHRRRAYERAAAAALGWEEEVADLLAQGRDPSELPYIGSGLALRLRAWFDDPPEAPDVPPSRRGFLTRAEVRRILDNHPWVALPAGDLQMHTTYSDGKATVAEMALAARQIGRAYIAVTDHSTGQPVPRGMDTDAAARQRTEVLDFTAGLAAAGEPFRVIHGIEMNLSPSGEPALSADERSSFSWVIGSFHSSLQTQADQTSRYIDALRRAGMHALGHPTCRRFGRRPGLVAEWDRVFDTAADAGIAVEINAHPHRQDLPVSLARRAAAAGCLFSIGTDAHDRVELEHFDFGLAIAVAADIPRERIVNFWAAEDFLAWVGAEAAG